MRNIFAEIKNQQTKISYGTKQENDICKSALNDSSLPSGFPPLMHTDSISLYMKKALRSLTILVSTCPLILGSGRLFGCPQSRFDDHLLRLSM